MIPARPKHPAAGGDLREYRRAYLSTLPTTVAGTVERAFAGTASPRAAIKAYCLVCCCCDRTEVAECPTVTCPLHAYRPFQKGPQTAKAARGSEPCDGTGSADVPGGAA